MIKFDEQKQFDSVQNALALRGQIEQIVDAVCAAGFRNLYFLGIGGTWASALQAEVHMKERSALWVNALLASEYNTTGNRCVGSGSVVIFSSVTGTTVEVVESVRRAKEAGAVILGFVDTPDTPLYAMSDYVVSYPANEQLKLFMVADRFMFNHGEFPEYERYYRELDAHLAHALINVEKQADDFGRCFAEKHHDDPMHYFIGCGNQYGSTYSYAMCYWEEQHWLRSKSIHAGEFFHGTLEVIDRDTPVTLFIGEDTQRPLAERVARFLPSVCANYTIIDTRDYELPGISTEFRGNLSHLVSHAVTQRIDAHIERINCHPMQIRRYYRQWNY